MNEGLIEHYQRGIDLTKIDIRKVELEIHCQPLCDTIDQRSLILSYEGIIKNLQFKIDQLDVNQW
jgi:hypothetical protein